MIVVQIPYVNLAAQHAASRNELLDAVRRVLDSGDFILGAETRLFEEEFAALCEVPHAVGVNSGTDALVLAMRALGIGRGDEVITAPNSYLASASSIALAGAEVRFADVCEDFNLDPEALEKAITPKTKAVIAVHLTGRPARMDEIMAVAKRHGLRVIEDAAQAVGARLRERPVGSIGDVGCFSLHPLKNLGACGDAGVAVTRDKAVNERIRLLRNHGHTSRDDCSEFSMVSRLDSVQAAMLRTKLRKLDSVTARRRENAAWYREALAGCPQVLCPDERAGEFAVYHTFIVRAQKRDQLAAHLTSHGIGCAVHYPVPIHLMEVGRKLGFRAGMFPIAESLAGRILSLPIYPELTKDDVMRIAGCTREFYDKNK